MLPRAHRLLGGAALAHCPFCHGDVGEELVLNGGTCQHCFGEIPGEETPTDPGEEVKAQMREEDLRHARRRTLLPVFILTPVALALVIGAAVVALRPPPEVEEIVLGDEFFTDFRVVLHAADPAEEAEAKAGASGSGAKSGGSTGEAVARKDPSQGRPAVSSLVPSAALLDGSKSVAGSTDFSGAGTYPPDGRRVEAPGSDRLVGGDLGPAQLRGGELGGSSGFDLNVGVQRTAPLLETNADITAAFGVEVKRKVPQLVQCYERRLKAVPDLRGTWRFALTIGTDGKFTDVSVEGLEGSDAELEACMVQRVASWGIYARLKEPKPVKFPLPLRPG